MSYKNLCISEFKQRDYYRYICALRTGVGEQDKILSLYSFYLELAKIKDVINQPMAGFIRLQWWRDALQEIVDNEKVISHKHHISQFLCESEVIKKAGFDELEPLIKAREIEIECEEVKSLDDLKIYAINTEGQMNRVLQKIYCDVVDDKLAENFAISYSFAMMMQSVRNNAKHGRLFIPNEMLDLAEVSKDDVLAGKNLDKIKETIKQIHQIAEDNLNEAFLKIKKLPKKQKVIFAPIVVASIVLKNIKKCDYDIFMHGVAPSRFKALWGILFF